MENPYAPPKEIDDVVVSNKDETQQNVLSREGNLIVCPDNATWPDRCAVCNAPVSGPKLTRRFFWHPSWIYLLFLVSWLIYLIVALIVRKKGTVHISVCEEHRKRRTAGILIASLGTALSLILLIAGAVMSDSNGAVAGAMVLLGIVGIILCLVLGLVMAKTVAPMKIVDGILWVRAGKAFTDSI
ncbi:MAG: hypothetical protein JXX14_07205 [Deltaproteobacteria bacterium]|nr:hypothetical protein [Deltaproteobacteria bacterium]